MKMFVADVQMLLKISKLNTTNILITRQSTAMLKKLFYGFGIAIIIIFCDQYSKWWITINLKDTREIIPITDFLNIVLTYNTGVSFGLFANDSEVARWILVSLTIAISLILIRWLSTAKNSLNIISFGMIIGGAIGNITDRVLIGAVIDFLDFYVSSFHWPAFNVADSAICIGAALLILESLLITEKKG